MADHLYYSCWLRNFSALNMLRQYGKMLELFPFSPQNPADSVLRVQAVSTAEPVLMERAFLDPIEAKEVAAAAEEFLHDDCAYMFETWWGLWTYEKDWTLQPARVTLQCFGPRFSDSPVGDEGAKAEHLRVDFGLDTWFLPQAELPNSAWYARSNLKGLLKFVHSLDEGLPVERRALWTETGGNFAERLREAAGEL
ncbi:MAG: hypothetical protein JNM66_08205 [Bryobacterales bacterium]|nr:hypothetical protein [Bryobacterales bacterium]